MHREDNQTWTKQTTEDPFMLAIARVTEKGDKNVLIH